jgi:hypothetical protein
MAEAAEADWARQSLFLLTGFVDSEKSKRLDDAVTKPTRRSH